MINNFRIFLIESEDEAKYSFNELTDEAKRSAIEKNYDINIYEGWDEPVIEGFIEEMESAGLRDVDVMYSGFNSQGDGASFTGKVSDIPKFLKIIGVKMNKIMDEVSENIYISITRNTSGYYHHNTVSCNVCIDGEDEIEVRLGLDLSITVDVGLQCDEIIEPKMSIWVNDKCKKLYNSLEDYYEDSTSDKSIIETFISNDYRFDKNGNII